MTLSVRVQSIAPDQPFLFTTWNQRSEIGMASLGGTGMTFSKRFGPRELMLKRVSNILPTLHRGRDQAN